MRSFPMDAENVIGASSRGQETDPRRQVVEGLWIHQTDMIIEKQKRYNNSNYMQYLIRKLSILNCRHPSDLL